MTQMRMVIQCSSLVSLYSLLPQSMQSPHQTNLSVPLLLLLLLLDGGGTELCFCGIVEPLGGRVDGSDCSTKSLCRASMTRFFAKYSTCPYTLSLY